MSLGQIRKPEYLEKNNSGNPMSLPMGHSQCTCLRQMQNTRKQNELSISFKESGKSNKINAMKL